MKSEVRADRRIRNLRSKQSGKAETAPRFKLPGFLGSAEHLGLGAMLLFGLGLISLGGSLLFGGSGDLVEIVAAAAVRLPSFTRACARKFVHRLCSGSIANP